MNVLLQDFIKKLTCCTINTVDFIIKIMVKLLTFKKALQYYKFKLKFYRDYIFNFKIHVLVFSFTSIISISELIIFHVH